MEEWAATTTYTQGQLVSYKGMLLNASANHTSTSTLAADLANWSSVTGGAIIVNQAAHGFSQYTPLYQSGGVWAAATALSETSLATHVVLEAGTDYLLLSDSGTYTYTHGLTADTAYFANNGTYSTTEATYFNPIFTTIGTGAIEITSSTPAVYPQGVTGILYSPGQTVTVSDDYQILTTDGAVFMDGAAADKTVTLPASMTSGFEVKVKNKGATYNVGIARNGNTIDGEASDITLTPGMGVILYCDTPGNAETF